MAGIETLGEEGGKGREVSKGYEEGGDVGGMDGLGTLGRVH